MIKQRIRNKIGKIIFYMTGGLVFGFLFPLLVSIAKILNSGLIISVDNFVQVQTTTPVLWIIDLIPIITAYLGYIIAKRQSELQSLAEKLEAKIVLDVSEMSIQINYFESLYDNIPAPVVTFDVNQKVQTCNPAFEELFQYKKEEILNKFLDPLISDKKNLQNAQKITLRVSGGKSVEDHGIRRRKDGSEIEVEIKGVPIIIDHQQVGSIAIYNDVTQKIKLERALRKSMKNLEVMALRDSLTGLLNRRAITDYAASEMERAKRENSSVCFALVDMDNLKEINDKYGHLVGDEALKKIGETINNSCRSYDRVGRWGGDEFLIIFSNNDRDGCSVLSKRIKEEVNRRELMVLNGKKIQLEICIGVVHYSMEHGDKTTIEELINQADEALYKAKQSGRNQVRFYSDILTI